MAKASTDLELLVAKIQKQLAPHSEVLHDVKLDGHLSRRQRQIDVLIRDKIGQYEILIIVNCKDYKKPVDVKGIEEFAGLQQDVRAHRGVLVCPKGFSKAAKVRAQSLQIDLYSPVDTDPHKWSARVTIPALCDFRSAAMSFYLSSSAPGPFRTTMEFYKDQQFYDQNDQALGTAFDNAMLKWNRGEFPSDVGEHKRLAIFDKLKMRMENGYGTMIPVDIGVSLHVSRRLYYGQYPIKQLSGFKDEISGGIITNAFTVGLLDPELVENQWKLIGDESEAPVKPVLVLRGLVGWAEAPT